MNPRGEGAMNRRAFIARGGALIVSFSLLPRLAGAQAAKLPGSLRTEPMLDAWIRIDAEGRISVFTGKAELGQGIKTALTQVAAEQLMVEPRRIELLVQRAGHALAHQLPCRHQGPRRQRCQPLSQGHASGHGLVRHVPDQAPFPGLRRG